MTRRLDEAGHVYGRLTVLESAPPSGSLRFAMWRCRCECGNEAVVRGSHLRKGVIRSCGCRMNERPLIPAEERFWQKVDLPQDLDGCWIWTAAKTRGYGRFKPVHRGPNVSAHRYAYEILVGPIPEGLQLDHLCRVPACVNPEHLEPVTPRENTLRGIRSRARTSAGVSTSVPPDPAGSSEVSRRGTCLHTEGSETHTMASGRKVERCIRCKAILEDVRT